jgi:hypothetical protein
MGRSAARRLPRESRTRERFASFAGADRVHDRDWRSSDSPYLELNGTWDDYSESAAKFRSNVRNRLSRLTRLGEPALESIEWIRHRGALADTIRLEVGWKRHEGTRLRQMNRPASTRLATGRRAWLATPLVSDRWRAHRDVVFAELRAACSFKTGYDPEFATGAPFKILTYFAIREAYRQGLTEVDFLGDAEPWKLEWTSASRGHDWVFVFADTMRARLLHSIKFQWVPELKRWRA